MISINHGTTRVTLCVGRYAIKIAKSRRGRFCNKFESALWARTTEARRKMLCPIVATMPFGIAVVMPRALPLIESESIDLIEVDGFPDWDYVPPDETEPFEYKASDCGWLSGRLVALDYSAPAL
jgi:hypothetical protein